MAEDAPLDQELFERASGIVREEVGELAKQGRLSIKAEWTQRSEEPGDWSSGRIVLTPAAPEATGIDLGVLGDTVSVGTGSGGAYAEVWTRVDDDWELKLRRLIRCVRDGRYSERVSKGWLSPLKVVMRFEGSASGDDRSSDYTHHHWTTLRSAEGKLPMPPTGEFTYDPW
jgi:hypothetical protein